MEIEPAGKRHGNIVWEWHFWDHLIQDYDPKQSKFGDPAAHPELMDINMGHELPEPISEDSMEVLHAQHQAWRNQTVTTGVQIFTMSILSIITLNWIKSLLVPLNCVKYLLLITVPLPKKPPAIQEDAGEEVETYSTGGEIQKIITAGIVLTNHCGTNMMYAGLNPISPELDI